MYYDLVIVTLLDWFHSCFVDWYGSENIFEGNWTVWHIMEHGDIYVAVWRPNWSNYVCIDYVVLSNCRQVIVVWWHTVHTGLLCVYPSLHQVPFFQVLEWKRYWIFVFYAIYFLLYRYLLLNVGELTFSIIMWCCRVSRHITYFVPGSASRDLVMLTICASIQNTWGGGGGGATLWTP